MRNRTALLLMVLTVFSLSAAALAAPAADTLLTHGYDSDQMALVFRVSPLDDKSENDCARDGRFGDNQGRQAASPSCSFVTLSVVGPNGQVNHGQIVRAFSHAIRSLDLGFNGKGCLMRILAGSDYGKGDQQVKAGDAVEGDTFAGVVDLTSVETSCNKGKDKSDRANDDSEDHDSDDDDSEVKPAKKEKTNRGQSKKADSPAAG